MMDKIMRKIIFITVFVIFSQATLLYAGTTGSEELKKNNSENTASECFEGVSRAMFKLNHGLDKNCCNN